MRIARQSPTRTRPGRIEAWKDEVAPEEGSPFRPLYDDSIKFNGQPIALVVAEDWETAKFAATLVHVEYREEQAFATDLEAGRRKATEVKQPLKPRGDAAKALAGAPVRHEADYVLPTEHHNPMELYASTVVWDGNGRLTVYDKTQGVQNVQRFLCSVFDKKPDDIRVLSPYVGGAFGSGLRPQYEVVLATLAALALKRSVRGADAAADVWARPPAGDNRARRPRRQARRHARCGRARGHGHHVALRGFRAQRQRLGGTALQKPKRPLFPQARPSRRLHPLRHARARRSLGRVRARMRHGRAGCRPQARPDRATAEVLLGSRPERRPALHQQAAAQCYARGAEAFGWSSRNPTPRAMRDGKELVGWGMATGVWEALQMPVAGRIVLTANGHAEVSCAASDIGTGTYTIVAQVAADALGLPIESISVKLADSTSRKPPSRAVPGWPHRAHMRYWERPRTFARISRVSPVRCPFRRSPASMLPTSS
jgi:xanthine dehydrogenase YagR molybdenum-binding subunit